MKKKLKPKLSKCCKAKCEVHGDAEYVSFVCSKCKEECSFEIQNHWKIAPQDEDSN